MRINRHQMFMEMAQVVAKRSTCFRESVGAIIVQDNTVTSMGYNGVPSGHEHCSFHPQGKCTEAIHAEVNALNRMDESGLYFCDLYVTHLPCLKCAQAIIDKRRIRKVYFQTTYGDPEIIYKLLDEALIPLLRVLPSGTITSWNREEILDV